MSNTRTYKKAMGKHNRPSNKKRRIVWLTQDGDGRVPRLDQGKRLSLAERRSAKSRDR